ncbi:hypothetical protein C2I18_26965 [Paenibacillus sp. PK3_47]|uniref:glycosyltransferase family 61 protein n=1 Tax=Paenibacillus sp. PK3_47 TaxID=2072642 RepID=UPI00201E3F60|nr:glycosyltransferase 61 family protein [Paenibacillus sp. PK3_47]UQZ36851.1 hypothetical protein C2I18_26965 [Paenibacillus sp. PK3_47]
MDDINDEILPVSQVKAGYFNSIWEWQASFIAADAAEVGTDAAEVGTAAVDRRTVIPFDFGGIAVFEAPKSIETEIHPYLMPYSQQPEGGYVAFLQSGRVWGQSGAVLTPDGRLIHDLSPEYDGEQHRMLAADEHPAMFRQKDQEPQKIHGTAAVLTFCGSGNYFHWFYDVLPRLLMLKSMDVPYHCLIMNPYPHAAFAEETLRLFGIQPSSIIRTDMNLYLQADQLIVPSIMMNSHYPPWITDTLRTKLLPLRDTAQSVPERLYISRRKASYRRMVNENEIIQCLETYGFISVCPEDWSITGQIQLFASAKVIVGPHGAGLTNLAFCCEGTQVIEIFHKLHVLPTYWMISNHNKLDYYMLYGQEQASPSGNFAGLEDYYVELDRLKQTLHLAGIDAPGGS